MQNYLFFLIKQILFILFFIFFMRVKGLWSPYFQPLPCFAVFLHPLGIRARGTDFTGKISTEVFSEFASFSSAIIFYSFIRFKRTYRD